MFSLQTCWKLKIGPMSSQNSYSVHLRMPNGKISMVQTWQSLTEWYCRSNSDWLAAKKTIAAYNSCQNTEHAAREGLNLTRLMSGKNNISSKKLYIQLLWWQPHYYTRIDLLVPEIYFSNLWSPVIYVFWSDLPDQKIKMISSNNQKEKS
jgi:hypothetical protein